jgi:hypothetical protein
MQSVNLLESYEIAPPISACVGCSGFPHFSCGQSHCHELSMDFDDIPLLINLFTILTRSTRGGVTTSCVYICVCVMGGKIWYQKTMSQIRICVIIQRWLTD